MLMVDQFGRETYMVTRYDDVARGAARQRDLLLARQRAAPAR